MNILTFGGLSFKTPNAVITHAKAIPKKYQIGAYLLAQDKEFYEDLLSIAPKYQQLLNQSSGLRVCEGIYWVGSNEPPIIYNKVELVNAEGWSHSIPLSYWMDRLRDYEIKYQHLKALPTQFAVNA
jgi:hypothetical protein